MLIGLFQICISSVQNVSTDKGKSTDLKDKCNSRCEVLENRISVRILKLEVSIYYSFKKKKIILAQQ